ncbi:bifunctional aconitate hydratase 2/2-methylisocitrate dehydratase [Celerinatantimonas diazotrophica]|uniref:Aconitate hydratase B n=1 Tax=Celerinatantimonas diazotrophica TaxID=412034 RepID=A0A4R1J7H2_9GAMM|nr:bifunctional aconitate hydratase 2/2-methylisocitrate dehydratase [Celerinatantimonas diazotrophica]TCK46409.1 aconitase [Celerinatantimonas diazotrophica]CAG9295215.1 Aconitate hydratase B [Celerinatantimonas diazotrophica]
MLEDYQQHCAERAKLGIPPQPLTAAQVVQLTTLLEQSVQKQPELIELLEQRVPCGVDDAAKIKAEFLARIALDGLTIAGIDAPRAIELLGTMRGGYNIQPLIDALDIDKLAPLAANALSQTLLIFDKFDDVAEKCKANNPYAKQVMQSWADAQWFLSRPAVAEKITLTVFNVPGETNTDDLSPAPMAWSRPDIPLHAMSMLANPREGVTPDKAGEVGPLQEIATLKAKGNPLIYVGDVVGTGSSRKSATNSLLWNFANDIPYVPNQRDGGYVIAGKIAPIFFNTLEDSGALPMEGDVSALKHGQVIDLLPYQGQIQDHESGQVIGSFQLKTDILLDEVRAGGRLFLIIGRKLTAQARQFLNLPASDVFRQPKAVNASNKGFSLAQKMVGKACNCEGVRPGQYCEPKMTTVGSQDTTGGMTRDELKNLACLKFSADLVMQSFCHTSAYPNEVDVKLQHTLPEFIASRGGVALRPGDGIIHSWLNRMLLPNTVGTGGDSHTRFPLGISFPAGSGLVAFAAATGMMPLDMPESVLVRFKGKMQPHMTLRDLVHAIPYCAIQQGLLTVEKQNKKNIFSGRIIEIEGLNELKAEQAFELADATAERSAAACTVQMSQENIEEYIRSNIALLRWMIAQGYSDAQTLQQRVDAMQQWLDQPTMIQADPDAEYAAVIDIDLADITEPLLCAPNDPDDVRRLSDVANNPIDEVFIGSCMTNIGHFRATGQLLEQSQAQVKAKLWLAPPTKMDAKQLAQEGYLNRYIRAGARVEPAGCSLCMGNQARVAPGCQAVSTSTRNFPNRLGSGAHVYLASAELSAIIAILGYIPTAEEYHAFMEKLDPASPDVYRYLNFDQIDDYCPTEQTIAITPA